MEPVTDGSTGIAEPAVEDWEARTTTWREGSLRADHERHPRQHQGPDHEHLDLG